jgi:hypothetical protein
MEEFPNEALSRSRRQRSRGSRRFGILGAIAGLALFLGAVYLSGRLGVEMARNRLPEKESEQPELPESETLRVGRSGDPLYLAQTPDALRRFFAAHPTPEDRASANLSGLGIRRLQDSMELTTLRTEADAVEVKVASGAIAGAMYWIHHSQLPQQAALDPIISPVPGAILE